MRSTIARLRRLARGREGVALPLALLGLVSVSLLVTTAMVTSSTELAISGAHQDATRGLYVAEGGLQAFVAVNSDRLAHFAKHNWSPNKAFEYPVPGGGASVDINVVHLGTQALPDDGTGNSRELRVFSVRSSPTGGGRSLTMLVKQVATDRVLPLTVTAPLASGGGISTNSGSTFLVDGADECTTGELPALRYRDGETLPAGRLDRFQTETAGGSVVINAQSSPDAVLQKVTQDRAQFFEELLPGMTLDELVASIPREYKFGTRYTGVANDALPRTVDGIAVIDGANNDVAIREGKGLLIVTRGHVRLAYNGKFSGVIISEGGITLEEWGNDAGTVTGAVVTLNEQLNTAGKGRTNEILGDGVIQYSSCDVAKAQKAYGKVAKSLQISGDLQWAETAR